MDLKKPPFFIALVLMALVVIVETASSALLDHGASAGADLPTPGYGIRYLALIDGLLLLQVAIMGSSYLLSDRIVGRVQGVASLVVTFFALLGSILLIFATLAILLLMVGLLVAPIFGTIAYFATYGRFDKPGANVTLGLLLALKFGFAFCLVLAQPGFLKNKGLVLLLLTSLLAQVILGFLHGFVPRPLVSITDAVGGIVNALLAAIWALVLLIGAIIGTFKAFKKPPALA